MAARKKHIHICNNNTLNDGERKKGKELFYSFFSSLKKHKIFVDDDDGKKRKECKRTGISDYLEINNCHQMYYSVDNQPVSPLVLYRQHFESIPNGHCRNLLSLHLKILLHLLESFCSFKLLFLLIFTFCLQSLCSYESQDLYFFLKVNWHLLFNQIFRKHNSKDFN